MNFKLFELTKKISSITTIRISNKAQLKQNHI